MFKLKESILIVGMILLVLVSISAVSATDTITVDTDTVLENNTNEINLGSTSNNLGSLDENTANTTNNNVGVANTECDDDVLNVLPLDTVINNNSYVSMSENTNLNVVEVSGANADYSFSTLAILIKGTELGGSLILNHDYIMEPQEVSYYADGIVINKNITIIGNGYCINADKLGRIFYLDPDVVLTLKNITLKNGNSDYGGAIYAWYGKWYGNVTVKGTDVSFVNNTATLYGGAIYAESGSVSVNGNDVSFVNNTANGSGGAISAKSGSVSVNGADVSFVNNTAGDCGGAINAYGNVTVTGNSVSFVDNSATDGSGGAIDAWEGNVTVTGSSVSFVNNTATLYGGAIYAYSGGVSVNANSNVIFVNNSATNGSGGAIYANSVSVNAGNDVIFVNNSAIRGGAISANGRISVNVNGDNVSFVNNSATNGSGGAISASGRISVNVNGSVSFVNNSATNGSGGAISAGDYVIVDASGSVSFVNNSATNGSGGAISAGDSVNVNGNDVSFVNNTANGSGGAISAGDYVSVYASMLDNMVSFVNNLANGDGGAISAGDHVNVNGNGNDVSFVNNTANGDGGAISAGDYVIVKGNGNDVSFVNNSAKYGDSLYITDGSSVISDCVFTNELSNNSQIYLAGGNLTLSNNTFNVKTGIPCITVNNKGKTSYQPCIVSNVTATVMNNQTVNLTKGSNYIVEVTFCDDNDNSIAIINPNAIITIGDKVYNLTNNGTVHYYKYIATDNVDSYLVSTNCTTLTNITVKTGTLNITPPRYDFTELDDLIQANTTITLNHNYIMYSDEVTTYQNGIFINKNITIIGNGYCINANKTGRIFNITNGVVLTLKNITLINGNTISAGGAIYSEGTVSVVNSTFTNNNASLGGVIYNYYGANFTVVNSTFADNTAINYGGVIYNKVGVGFSVVNSTFKDNVARDNACGGVIYNQNGDSFTVVNSTFIGNNANEGGVINNYGGADFTIVNSTFIDNTASTSGGVILNTASAGNFTVITSTFIGNTAKDEGGVIYNTYDNFTILNSTFTDNNATHGGVISNNGADFTIVNSTCIDNNATYGGVIYNYYGDSFTVANSTFNNNKASKEGGVIYNNVGASFTVINSIFTANTVSIEGVITNSNGCVIYNNGSANFTVVNSTFADNSVEGGAVIYNTGINCTVINSTFSGNNARNRGGVIYNAGANFTIVNSTFIGNHDMVGVSTVYQNCILTVLVNNQPVTSVKPNEDFNLTAKIVDNQGNTYYSTGLTYQIYNETGLVKEITADNLFNAKTNLTNSGFYNISANYTDPGHTITTYDVINASVCVNTLVLLGEDLTKYYKGDENYNIYLKLNDNPLVGETVAVTINGITYDFVTDNNGLISLPIGLSAGNYKISSVYNGSYGVASLENNITVNPTIVGSETELYYRNGTAYNVCIIDSQGKIVTSGKVRFNINGVYYDISINNGTASLPIGLNAGTYIITAENPTNGEKTSNNVTVLPTVTGEDISIYHRNGSGYSVKVVDGQGNPAKGVTVKMNVNGVFYNVVTDEEGIATLKIGLSPGDYIITAEYNGFKTSNKITVLPVLVGSDVTLHYRNGTNYTVQVLDGQGQPLVGVNVTMNINGVFYYRTTGIDGVADLPIGLLPGTYIITTTYQDHATSNTVTVLP